MEKTHSDTDFARVAMERGYCTREMVQEAMREITSLGDRGQHVQLGQVLVRKRYMTPQQFVELVALLDESILRCPSCGTTHHVVDFDDRETYVCKRCGAELRPHSRPQSAELDTHLDGQKSANADTSPLPADTGARQEDHTLLYGQMADSDPTSPVPPPDAPRRKIGKYNIIEQVGRGGMGVVYRARQEVLDREVALKVLFAQGMQESERVQRFVREGQIISRLEHENIIKIYDWGQDGELYYFAMEFVEGTTLDKYVEKHPLSQKRALQLIETVARAVHYAHTQGVIHRDLKPGNVLVAHDGAIRIMDFGLARVMGDDDQSLTRTGQPMGTPYYMSPEQCRGEKRKIDHRSDIYSMGAMLYELLSGRRPFSGRSTVDLYQKIQSSDPTSLRQQNPTIPKPVEDVCMKAMAKDQEDRYPSAEEFAEDLARFLAGQPIDPKTMTGAWRRKKLQRLPLLVGILGATAAVLAVVAGFLYFTREPKKEQNSQERKEAWREPKAAFEEAIRIRDYDAARELLAQMKEKEAPREELARAEEHARLNIEAHYNALVDGDELRLAAELLKIGPELGVSAELTERLRRRALDRAFERVRKRLVDQDYEGADDLIRAVRVAFGDDPELRSLEWWANGLCPLTLSSEPPGLPVRAQRYDQERDRPLGEEIDLGQTPVEERAIKFGFYIIRMEPPGRPPWTFPLEFSRGPDGRPVPLRFHFDLARVPQDMVFVPAGEFVFGPPQAERRLPLASFLIDRTEVTNAEYARFLAALPSDNHRLRYSPSFAIESPEVFESPFQWIGFEAPRGKENVPVNRVTYDDARQYCRWAKKRMPTREEWEKAARGIDGRTYPWGRTFDSKKALLAAAGVSNPVAAGSFPAGASPYGCLDLCGNLKEFSSTRIDDDKIWTKGGAYDSEVGEAAAHGEEEIADNIIDFKVGFRCCRTFLDSTDPEALVAAFSSPVPGTRHEAARLAGEAAGATPELVQALLAAALRDPDEDIRYLAATSLARHLDAATFDGVLKAAREGKGDERDWALDAAVLLAPPERLANVVAFLGDEDDGVCLRVKDALLERHEPRAEPLYLAILEDESRPALARSKAAILLAALRNDQGRKFLCDSLAGAADDHQRYAYAFNLWWVGEPIAIVPILEMRFRDTVGLTDGNITWFLSRYIRDRSGVPELRKCLAHEKPEIRAIGCQYLGLVRDKESFDAIFRLASDVDPKVREAANNALERLR